MAQRVFSGIQPSGDLHIGNYLGAIKHWVRLQSEYETVYCIVDWHAITVPYEPRLLKERIRYMAAGLLACGVDEKRSVLFCQSHNSDHAELAWIFNGVARMGWLKRMTQFKEKSGKNQENASVGLFVYPILMAADILAYQATHVPVGEDQKQHLELARDIAQKFNTDFGEEFFPLPKECVVSVATRIRSLRDGSQKMSKSDPSDYSRINLTDDSDAIALKIRKARTDAHPLPSDVEGLEGRVEARNLVNIYAALSDGTPEIVLQKEGGGSFAVFKARLAELAVEKIAPVTAEMRRLLDAPDHIDALLAEGVTRAQAMSGPVLNKVRLLTGVGRINSD